MSFFATFCKTKTYHSYHLPTPPQERRLGEAKRVEAYKNSGFAWKVVTFSAASTCTSRKPKLCDGSPRPIAPLAPGLVSLLSWSWEKLSNIYCTWGNLFTKWNVALSLTLPAKALPCSKCIHYHCINCGLWLPISPWT